MAHEGAVILETSDVEALKDAGLWRADWATSKDYWSDGRLMVEGAWDDLAVVACSVYVAHKHAERQKDEE